MKKDDSFLVKQITELDELIEIIMLFSDKFPYSFKTKEQKEQYAKKIYTYGHCLVCYLDEIPLGFATFYANDTKTRCTYGSLLAIDSRNGFLRGLIWKELIAAVLKLAKESGMVFAVGEVRDNNEYARKQYEKMGMKLTERASDHSSFVKGEIDTMLLRLR